jgi:hypothetical protein
VGGVNAAPELSDQGASRTRTPNIAPKDKWAIRMTGACSLREAAARATIPSRQFVVVAAAYRRPAETAWAWLADSGGARCPEGDARKSRDSERREPWTGPKLQHGNVVTGALLEDPQGATLGRPEGHAFSSQHCGRGSKPGIASSGDRAVPEIAETGELTGPDRIMEPSQGAGLVA